MFPEVIWRVGAYVIRVYVCVDEYYECLVMVQVRVWMHIGISKAWH